VTDVPDARSLAIHSRSVEADVAPPATRSPSKFLQSVVTAAAAFDA
jgi:hypothetical protein